MLEVFAIHRIQEESLGEGRLDPSLGHIASHYCLGHNQLLLACLRLSNSLIKEVNSHHEMLVNEDLFSPACLI